MGGRLIAFEGGEGAGKSTQIRRLAAAFARRGEAVLQTREPGGTPGAERIRQLFVGGSGPGWAPATDVLLVTAARAEHVAKLVQPALTRGTTVLCDRFVHSTLAYQGYGSGVDLAALRLLHRFATNDLWPDLVVWLDLPVEVGLARSRARDGADAQRFEGLSAAFHARVRQGFTELAQADRRIVRVDASQTPDAVAQQIEALLFA